MFFSENNHYTLQTNFFSHPNANIIFWQHGLFLIP